MASELAISNGHAARMRYSRFRNQMEGPSNRTKKKNPKKAAKEGLQVDMPTTSQPPASFLDGRIPLKMEPVDFSSSSSALIKCELDTKPADLRTLHEYSGLSPWPAEWVQTIGPTTSMTLSQIPPYTPPGMASTLSSNSSSTLPSSDASHYPAPYLQYSLPYDINMQEVPMQQPDFSSAPSIPWEHPVTFIQDACAAQEASPVQTVSSTQEATSAQEQAPVQAVLPVKVEIPAPENMVDKVVSVKDEGVALD